MLYNLRVQYSNDKHPFTVATGLTAIQLRCDLAERMADGEANENVLQWIIHPVANSEVS